MNYIICSYDTHSSISDKLQRKNFERPQIVQDLELKKHGLEWFVREPHAFTPLKDDSRYLLLGSEYVSCKLPVHLIKRHD